MKRFLVWFTTIILLSAFIFPIIAYADIEVDQNFAPLWSEDLLKEQNLSEPLWKPFYMNKEEKKVKFDLVSGSGGKVYEWHAPDELSAIVWEGTNVVAPTDNNDVGYMFTAPVSGSVEFHMAGKLETSESTDVTITVYKNSFSNKIYPTESSEVTVTKGQEIVIDFEVDLIKDDRIFIMFHSPVEVAVSSKFRFVKGTGFYARYSKIGEPTSTDTGGDPTQSDVTSPDESSIIIDDPDLPAITSTSDDVTVDIENNTITINKELSLNDYIDSFNLKEGHTLKLYYKNGALVEDDETDVTSEMVMKLFNKGTPINVFKIETTYAVETKSSDIDSEEPDSNTWIYILVASIVIIVIGTGITFIIKRKNNA